MSAPVITLTVVTFQGWPSEALDFYEGLEADNTKTYWLANKKTYETCVLEPMQELMSELEPEYGEGRIFRPYRDVRFSKDKAPYKTAIAGVISTVYIQVSAQGLACGGGMHYMAPDQLDRYRKAVDSDACAALTNVVEGVRAHGIDVHGHEVLKSAPRGYRADHPQIELLRCKGLIAWKQWDVEPWLGTAAARDRITEFAVAARPLNDWMDEHVGESTLPPR